jgi:hypothetical protein
MPSFIGKGLLIFPILKDLNQADGILVKNDGIRSGFILNGVEVEMLDFTSKGIFSQEEQLYRFHPNRYRRIFQYNRLIWRELGRYVRSKEYQFIWFRAPIITAPIAQFIRKIKKEAPSCRIIIEYGAYPFVNELSGLRKTIYLLNRKNESIAHRYADFVITYCGQEKVDNLENIPINNGIDLSHIPVVDNKIDTGQRINFISVSSLKKWHAYERFIAGLASYIQHPNAVPVHFNIIGNGPEFGKLVNLTNELRLNEYVTFHNFKTGKELDAIYQQNHVAIGTLGFHRIGITNSSSLKNREYFGRGLPIVISTPDKDMPEELPYVKYVPEGEQPLDIQQIVTFAQSVYQNPNVNREIRQYAEEHVSWASKIKTVLEYID